jgi:GMP synthase (glutamine-hydrolysing)
MPKTAVAIRHVDFEHLGIIAPILNDAGYTARIADAGLDDLTSPEIANADLIVVLGGPIGAFEEAQYPFVADELRVLETRLASGRPTLGICLGAQLMARALGARVYPGPAKEIGWSELSLSEEGRASPLRHLSGVPVLHWHGDTFDLPAGAVRLASTTICANQAFAIGRNMLGLQFHGETDAREIERWLIGHAAEIAATGLRPENLRRDSMQHGAKLRQAGTTLFSEWIARLT